MAIKTFYPRISTPKELVEFSGAKVIMSASQSISNTAWVELLFDTEVFDTDNYHSTTTNTGRLTAPFTGFYHVEASVIFQTNSTGDRVLSISKNGIPGSGGYELARNQIRAAGTYESSLSVGAIIYLTAGEYVTSSVFESGGTLNAVKQDDLTHFSIRFISTQ